MRHLLSHGLGFEEQRRRVRVMTRDVESDMARALSAIGAEVVQCDFSDPASLERVFEGVVAAFLACSNCQNQAALEKAFLAAAPPGTYIVKLSTCGAGDYLSKTEHGRHHAEVEAALAASSFRWTVLRPNVFMQNHLGDVLTSLPKSKLLAYPHNEPMARSVDARDVGVIAAKLLLEHLAGGIA